MKVRLLVILFSLTVLTATAFAQQDPLDFGDPDSLIMAMMHQPNVQSGDSSLILELYMVNDSQYVTSIGAGFTWEGFDGLVMDSAEMTPLAVTAFDFIHFLYYGDDIALTNLNKKFQFSGSRMSGDGVAPATGRQHIATYWFSVTAITAATDSIVFDTNQYSGGTVFKFVDKDNNNYIPTWGGASVVKDASDVTVIGANSVLPTKFELRQNYPNPFNPETIIGFDLPQKAEWKLTIYNVLGQVVEQRGRVDDAGPVSVKWDASEFSSGIYFYKVEAGNSVETRKMMLLK